MVEMEEEGTQHIPEQDPTSTAEIQQHSPSLECSHPTEMKGKGFFFWNILWVDIQHSLRKVRKWLFLHVLGCSRPWEWTRETYQELFPGREIPSPRKGNPKKDSDPIIPHARCFEFGMEQWEGSEMSPCHETPTHTGTAAWD